MIGFAVPIPTPVVLILTASLLIVFNPPPVWIVKVFGDELFNLGPLILNSISGSEAESLISPLTFNFVPGFVVPIPRLPETNWRT